jgi:murein DD-endopeptidase MepM/ murein hydrolase activator NlpD
LEPTEKIKNRYSGHYLLKIVKESTFEEIRVFRVTRLRMIYLSIIALSFMILIIGSLIFFTPIRTLIPGYPDEDFRQQLIENIGMTDSLLAELQVRDQYILNIKNILEGDVKTDYSDTSSKEKIYTNIDFSVSAEDSLLRESVDQEEYASPLESGGYGNSLGETLILTHFFPPVKGFVTNSIDFSLNHYGTDIVTEPNMIVKATLDGVVILSTWSLEYGYTMYIQHENNLISVYKHNAALLKKTGNRVMAGDAIAVVGNSGELSTGPHLHFELWFNGIPLNPEEYVNF